MSESRIQNAFSRTTILTVGRLMLFIVAGFAIGLLIGVASEEPELLAGHVRGDTATVELDGALAARAETDRAAAVAGSGSGSEQGEADDFVDGADAGGDLPDVAAPPAGYDGARRADVASANAGPAGGSPGVTSGPAASMGSGSTGVFAIQVGAFGDEPSARSLEARLESKGYPIEVLPAGSESNRWRVRVQPIAEEQTARGTAERIEREERLPTWVIRLEGQPRG
ncbi:MAG: SPOR domain-containing protein [Deltaproteobacteria bacterium]|nr:SPOR domain-containing protein [Deltaproteobacteria bacterium]